MNISGDPSPVHPGSTPEAGSRFYRARPLLALGFLVGLGLAGWGALSLTFDFTPQRIFESDNEDFVELQRVTETFGRDDTLLVVLVNATSGDLFEQARVAYVRELRSAVVALEGVQGVQDFTSAPVVRPGSFLPGLLVPPGAEQPALDAARELAVTHPLLAGRLVARDARAALLLVQIEPWRIAYADLNPVVHGVVQALEARPPPPGVQVRVTGIPTARTFIVENLVRDQLTFLPVCTLMFVAVLWFTFRDLRAVFVPLASVGVALAFTVGLLAWTGEPVNIINNVLPVLIFVIGMSDGIHLLGHYRRELAAGSPQPQAIEETVRRLAWACFLTSATTAIGFASLAVAKISILRRFGLYAAGGVLIAYAVTVLFLPLVLSLLSPRLGEASRRVDRWLDAGCERLGAWVIVRPWRVLLPCVLITATCAVLGSRVHEENNLYEAFSSDDPVVLANEDLERHFGGIIPVSLVLSAEPGRELLTPEVLAYAEGLQARVEREGGIGNALSIVDLVKEWNAVRFLGDPAHRTLPTSAGELRQAVGVLESLGGAELSRFYAPESRQLRIMAWASDTGTHDLTRSFDRIDGELHTPDALAEQRALGLRVTLTGDGPVANRGVNHLIRDLFGSLLLALGIIFVSMCLLLRSLRAGLVSMIPNAFPLVFTLGFMGLTGLDLRVTSVIVFSVSLGLAVDDTIHFMVRYRLEQRSRAELQPAILATFRGTGSAILITSLLLALGFASLLLSAFPISQTFGLLMLVTVLAAIVGDLLILPACLVLLRPFGGTNAAAPAATAGGEP
ncbi:MAG: RND family transporter [Planctomycetes bacterium]|nr:RND family transporter [Planctomycetota bacterium]